MTQAEFTSKLVKAGNVNTFEGNILSSTEHIQCTGSLVVNGDIESGVTLLVEGDCTVHGSVFEVSLTATGNVRVDESFIGGGKGKIVSGNDVWVSVVNGQVIIAKGSVTISVEAVKADITSYDKIDASLARIVGGKVEAGTEIVVKSLGSDDGQQTKIYLGNRKKLIQRLTDIANEEKNLNESLPKINDGIYKLNRLKVDGKALSPEQEAMVARLRTMRDSYPRQMELFKKEVEHVNLLLKEKSNATLSVREAVHENVLVDINGFKEVTETTLSTVRYKMGANGLLKEPLK
jgi:uncharacterized protein (DUF342 family)